MKHTICTSIHPPYLWDEEVDDPYLLLDQFFDYTSIELQHLYTETFVNAACSNSYVREKPGQLLSWYEKTTMLFYAARLLHNTGYPKETDIGVNVTGLAWKDQPHYLRVEELKNPYNVIGSFFEFMSYDQWLIELHSWLHAAMYEHSVLEEADRSPETIVLLHKLADAMWMLHLKHKDERKNNASPTDDDPEDKDETLVDEAPADPMAAMREAARSFFDVQPAADAKEDLWRMTKLAVTHSEDPDPIERGNMLYMYEQLCGVIDAMRKLMESCGKTRDS